MYAFWSFAYNNVFDFLSAIYIPIISDQSKSNTLQKIKFSLSSWLSQIKKKESLLYNSIVLICSEIMSQKKIHLTIFFYLSIKKALEDFLHDNRDSSHKHTEAMRLYAPSLIFLTTGWYFSVGMHLFCSSATNMSLDSKISEHQY